MNLDGNGHITGGSLTLSVNGTLNTFPVTGTYTENANCTGTKVITFVGNISNSNFVVVNGGKEILLIDTDTMTTISGNAQQ